MSVRVVALRVARIRRPRDECLVDQGTIATLSIGDIPTGTAERRSLRAAQLRHPAGGPVRLSWLRLGLCPRPLSRALPRDFVDRHLARLHQQACRLAPRPAGPPAGIGLELLGGLLRSRSTAVPAILHRFCGQLPEHLRPSRAPTGLESVPAK